MPRRKKYKKKNKNKLQTQQHNKNDTKLQTIESSKCMDHVTDLSPAGCPLDRQTLMDKFKKQHADLIDQQLHAYVEHPNQPYNQCKKRRAELIARKYGKFVEAEEIKRIAELKKVAADLELQHERDLDALSKELEMKLKIEQLEKYVAALRRIRLMQFEKIESLKKEKEELEYKYNKFFSQTQTQIHDLRESNKRMQQRYISVEDLYQRLLIKHESNECKTAQIMEEHKELEMKYNELETKCMEQQKRFGYESWTTKDLVNWIVAIDKGKYSKYYNDLLKNMRAEGIDGMCLTDLDKNDLKGLGITQFKDRVDVYNNIQKLLKKKKNDNYNNQNEGQSETFVGFL